MGALDSFFNVLLIIIFGTLGLVLLWTLYKKFAGNKKTKKKVQKASEDTAGTVKDSREFLKDLEDIRDGIVITDGGKRFVTAIMVNGVSDFYSQSGTEQLSVMYGYRGFVNTYERTEMYSIYAKEVDIDSIKERYSNKCAEVQAALDEVEEEMRLMAELREEKRVYTLRFNHLQNQMAAMNFYSSSGVVREETQCYVFDYVYDSSEYENELTPNEIFMRAKQELESKARAKIDALGQAGCSARLCTQSEMVDMWRRLSHPLTVDEFKQKDLEESGLFEDIIESESEEAMRELAEKERMESFSAGLDKIFSAGTAGTGTGVQQAADETQASAENAADGKKSLFKSKEGRKEE